MSQSIDVWDKRWSALERILQAEHEGAEYRIDGKLYPRYETLKNLRQCLYVFGRNHYDFFKNGFAGSHGVYLEPLREYPKEYVLSTILQQISFDLDVMARAEHFRMPTAMPEMRDTLNKADILAYSALAPAIKANLLPNTTVVTYFQKSVTVRLIPYAPVALIGIPFSAIDNPRDLLAIPHEVGHYVYRHGVFQDNAYKGARFAAILNKELAGRPQWLLKWVEEIFADVYGCLVAGPVIARSFQDLQAEWSQQDFMKDDSEHPIGALRPHVYHQVLEASGFCEAAKEALEKKWREYLATRRIGDAFTPATGDDAIKLTAANRAMDEVIKTIMDEHYLRSLLTFYRPSSVAPDSVWKWDDLEEGENVDRLYDKFTHRVQTIDMTVVVPELTLAEKKSEAKASVESIECKPGETGLWIDALKASKSSGRPLTMPPEIWTALLVTNGWAIEGPTGGNTH
jgi:hypothetical protein